MPITLVKTIADFTTTLTAKVSVGATTATLTSATDADGVSLPSGNYGFTIDRSNSSKEYFTADLSGTALTNIKTVTRGTGLGTAGFARQHRKGAEIIISDHVALKRIMNLIDGTTGIYSGTPMKYDASFEPTIGQFQIPTWDFSKDYMDNLSVAGAADASTTTKGVSRNSVSSDVVLGTATITIASPTVITLAAHGLTVNDSVKFTTDGALPTGIAANTTYYVISAGLTTDTFRISSTLGGAVINTSDTQSGVHTVTKTTPISAGTLDPRIPTQNENNALVGNNTDVAVGTGNKFITQTGLQHSAENYDACASASSTAYTATLSPVPTSLSAGMPVNIKIDVTNTTTTPTLNLNGLGAHTIKNLDGSALLPGQLYAGGIFTFIHDGATTWQLTSYAPLVPTIFSQDILANGTGTPAVSSFACATGGISTTEPLFVMTDTNSGSPTIIRYIKTSNGSLIATHSVVFSAHSSLGTGAKIVVMGNYVYGVGYNGSATLVRRWDKADLTNVTTITVSGTAFSLGTSLFSDGTNIYQCYSAGLAKIYTLSATTLTSGGDTSYTSMVTTDGTWCDGTYVYQLASGLTGYRWALAGGSRTTGTSLVSSTQLHQTGTLVSGSALIKEAGNSNYMYAMGLNNSTVTQVGRVIPVTIF